MPQPSPRSRACCVSLPHNCKPNSRSRDASITPTWRVRPARRSPREVSPPTSRCAPDSRCATSWWMNSRTLRSGSSSCSKRSPRAWEPGDGRTLFVVGDPMQSIYQFRDAEVGLFLRARDRGIGPVRLEALHLTRNFRSAPASSRGAMTRSRSFSRRRMTFARAQSHSPAALPARPD